MPTVYSHAPKKYRLRNPADERDDSRPFATVFTVPKPNDRTACYENNEPLKRHGTATYSHTYTRSYFCSQPYNLIQIFCIACTIIKRLIDRLNGYQCYITVFIIRSDTTLNIHYRKLTGTCNTYHALLNVTHTRQSSKSVLMQK